MASRRREATVIRVLFASIAVALAVAPMPPVVAAQPTCRDPGNAVPVLFVHGLNSNSEAFSKGSLKLSETATAVKGTFVDFFDYSEASDRWVTDPRIAPSLAKRISCLASRSSASNGPGKVVVVAHSMGGLATRQAVATVVDGRSVADRVGLVITVGTPHLGSSTEGVLTARTSGGISAWLFSFLYGAAQTGCGANATRLVPGLCEVVGSPGDAGSLAMRPGSPELAALPSFPADLPVLAIAGKVTITTDLFGLGRVEFVSGDAIGDLLVTPESANRYGGHLDAGGGSLVRSCEANVFDLAGDLVTGAFGWTGCTHGGLLSDVEVNAAVTASLKKLVGGANRLSTSSRIHVRGVGPVLAGMTVKEAERVSKVTMTIEPGWDTDFEGLCYHVDPIGVPGLSFMVVNSRRPGDAKDGTIVRASVYGSAIDSGEAAAAAKFLTLSGIHVGSTEADVQRAYPGKIRISGHEYDEVGRYLDYQPSDAADSGFSMRFTTDGRRVNEIHAGQADAVSLVEGCA